MSTEAVQISQMSLLSCILKFVDRAGAKTFNQRQFNAIVQAANLVVDEFSKPHVSVTPGMGLQAWLDSDETGMSSLTMADRLVRVADLRGGVSLRGGDRRHPVDPGDFGRCIGLLDAVPELRPHITEMWHESPEWRSLLAFWDEIEAFYREEAPTGKAPKLHARMKEILAS